MQTFFGSVWWLIVSLGILVTFHEFGHFWVARKFGIKVLRFSVGFGAPLWRRLGRDGTEYQIAAIPLGGYVKMLDEREQEVRAEDLDQAFNRKPVMQRIAVVAAGPVFNLLLCVALLWLMYLVGKPDYLPMVGRAEGIAAAAGLANGDRLLAIDGQPTSTWTDTAFVLGQAAVDRKPVKIEFEQASGTRLQRNLPLDRLAPDIKPSRIMPAVGLTPRHFLLPAVVGTLAPDSAATGLLQPGDRIIRIGTRPIDAWDQVSAAIQAEATQGEPLQITVRRGGELLDLMIQPRRDVRSESPRWIVGIAPQAAEAAYDTVQRYGAIDALSASLGETWRLARGTLAMLGQMLVGNASIHNLSGPLSIAQYANTSAQLGLAWFLFFLALMSLSLGIINLLPIPILDGGHLLYYLIELVKGSPVSERAMITGQYVGLTLLVGLMGLAFYSDIVRIFN
jgi:regulator of sigma E protease